MKKIFSTLTVCVAMVSVTNAQDPNFSQFFASPLTLNPAMTGLFDGTFRVAGNYRNQWPTIPTVYETKTASIDFGILKNRLPDIDQMGVGILGYTDRAGDGVLVTNGAGLSLAYHKGLDENGYHSISAGFQGAYLNKRLDLQKVYFEDELTPLGFVPGTTGEIFLNNQINVSYADINAGLLYSGTTNGYNNFYIGASMYHINRPKESFQGGEFILSPRTTLQAGGRIPVGSYNSLHFSANYSTQAKAKNIMIGGAFAYNVNNNEDEPVNVYLGVWNRFSDLNDAIIPYVGLEFKSLQLGYTYDINISSLNKATNSQGGNEISLIYIRKPVDRSLRKLNCPRF